MADFIKYCSDSFYASLDEFSIVFREVFGAGCFIALYLIFFFLLICLIYILYVIIKEKLISWKQRKADKDA